MGILPFVGKHDGTVDDKGRLSIPAEFRNALPSETQRHVVLTIGNEEFINVFPVDYFNNIYAPSENDSADSQTDDSLDRDMMLLEEAAVRPIDGQGRITLPQDLIELAKLGQKVVFFGRHKYFTIWNAEAYKARASRVKMTKSEAWGKASGKGKSKE